ncbi:MAG: type II toxin-antitoxin system VapC family toxin [Kiritimatiellaeota bacterium]|nr:type II toxin-antitoxin system VapC family toxin [Kiritimatiellota bacterium]
MNWLFDTCVVSEMIRSKSSPKDLEWIESIPEENAYISVLTLGELHKDAQKIADERRAQKVMSWLETDVIARFEGRILSVSNDIVIAWGALCVRQKKTGSRRPEIDGLIAATAQVHHLTVATRNVSDFLYTGISVFNPWE